MALPILGFQRVSQMWIHPPPDFDHNQALSRFLEMREPLSWLDGRGRYLHWDDVRHRDAPDGFENREEYWGVLKIARLASARQLPFTDTNGQRFWHCPGALEQSVFLLDREAAGNLGLSTPDSADRRTGERYVINGLMDEAIHSSQLEGADTGYARAKEMLRENRSPRDHGERMIFNNYRAMGHIVREFQSQPLTPDMIIELHSVLTDGTLDEARDCGRFRDCDKDDDGFGVYDRQRNKLMHRPPSWRELPERIKILCDFANQHNGGGPFVHPAVRAMVLHFMLAYDHPFIDGNGRTARALFYWAMARSGYRLAGYAPISAIIKRGARAYGRAFLLSEKDRGDLTYFLVYHLEVVLKALKQLDDYVKSREEELRRAGKQLVSVRGNWNHRQLALLARALRDPGAEFTYAGHLNSHKVTRKTAITDLDKLREAGLLTKHRRGRRMVFFPAENLRARLGGGESG